MTPIIIRRLPVFRSTIVRSFAATTQQTPSSSPPPPPQSPAQTMKKDTVQGSTTASSSPGGTESAGKQWEGIGKSSDPKVAEIRKKQRSERLEGEPDMHDL